MGEISLHFRRHTLTAWPVRSYHTLTGIKHIDLTLLVSTFRRPWNRALWRCKIFHDYINATGTKNVARRNHWIYNFHIICYRRKCSRVANNPPRKTANKFSANWHVTNVMYSRKISGDWCTSAVILSRVVESNSSGARVLAQHKSLPFEGDFDSGPVCLIWTKITLLQSIWILLNLIYHWNFACTLFCTPFIKRI